MSRGRITTGLALVLIVGGAANPYPANAQTTEAGALEEIVVTARKRTETLLEVPVAVTAFTADAIEAGGFENVADLAMLTPNLSYQSTYGRHFDRPVIRGMSNILGDSEKANAGNFIDGIFVSGSLFAQELDNLERVEIIKGPQSALFGRATFAGAINYITKRPDNEPVGRLSVSGGTDDYKELALSHSGALIPDQLYYYVGGRYYDRDNQYRNLGPGGGGAGGQNSRSLTGKLVYEPSERFQSTLRISYADDDDEEYPNELLPSSANNCFLTSSPYFCGTVPTRGVVALSASDLPDLGTERDTLRAHLQLEMGIGSLTLVSNTAYNDEDFARQTDQDFAPGTSLSGLLNQEARIMREDFAQEIRLSSGADQRLRWTAGAYYYHLEKLEERTTFATFATLESEQPPEEVDNVAVFGGIDYDFTDTLTGGVELRWNQDKLAVSGTSSVSGFSRDYDLSETFDDVTPRFTLSYTPHDNVNWYGSIAKGTKPGGFNTNLQAANIPDFERDRLSQFVAFEEEEAWSYEAGVKTRLADGRVRWNLSAFFIDWDQQQLTAAVPVQVLNPNPPPEFLPSNPSLIQNAGKTEIYGIETELDWRVTDQLSLSAGYGYIQGEFKEFDDITQAQITGNPSVAGNELPRSPKHTASFSARYDQTLRGDWRWFARGDVMYESSRYAQVHNFAETGSMERVNLRIGAYNDRWEITAWVRNLTDDDSATDITRFLDFFTFQRGFVISYPEKRLAGITANLRF